MGQGDSNRRGNVVCMWCEGKDEDVLEELLDTSSEVNGLTYWRYTEDI
jgi:hypothetical protein